MGKFFLPLGIVFGIVFLLFFPIFLEFNVFADVKRKTFSFSLYVDKIFRAIGGYATAYKGGICLHVGKKKAILLPFNKVDAERKKFSFTNAFQSVSFFIATQTGPEYLLPMSALHTASCIYFASRGAKRDTKLLVCDDDILKISAQVVSFFNLFILCKVFFKWLKEKVKALCQKKRKKSIA